MKSMIRTIWLVLFTALCAYAYWIFIYSCEIQQEPVVLNVLPSVDLSRYYSNRLEYETDLAIMARQLAWRIGDEPVRIPARYILYSTLDAQSVGMDLLQSGVYSFWNYCELLTFIHLVFGDLLWENKIYLAHNVAASMDVYTEYGPGYSYAFISSCITFISFYFLKRSSLLSSEELKIFTNISEVIFDMQVELNTRHFAALASYEMKPYLFLCNVLEWITSLRLSELLLVLTVLVVSLGCFFVIIKILWITESQNQRRSITELRDELSRREARHNAWRALIATKPVFGIMLQLELDKASQKRFASVKN